MQGIHILKKINLSSVNGNDKTFELGLDFPSMLELAQKESGFSGECKGCCSLIALPGGFFYDLGQTVLSLQFF